MQNKLLLTISVILIFIVPYNAQEKPNDKLVGLAYTTWHQSDHWQNVWGEPELGFYSSDNRQVIRQHGKWLADAGVDFIFVDWSNNINYDPSIKKGKNVFQMIESSTKILFEEFSKMKSCPKICIMAGVTGSPEAVKDGRLQKKVDQIYNEYIARPEFKKIYQNYLGKPLLIIYVNTPSPFTNGLPEWNDPRFTIRWMTGYIMQQSYLVDENKISKYGYWSWEDREEQTYSIYNGKPEAMTIVAAWRGDDGKGDPQPRKAVKAQGRLKGATFKQQWQRAINVGVNVALVVSWNEWTKGEQPSMEISKDLEPSEQFGLFYLDLLKQEIKNFKTGK